MIPWGYYEQNDTLILNLLCLGGILSSWESLVEVLMVFIIYECIFCFLFAFQYHLGWAVMWCLHLSYLLYMVPFLPCIHFIASHIFCQCLSRIMFRYCSKFEHSLTPNIFHQIFTISNSKKTGTRDLSDFLKLMGLEQCGNMLWSNEIYPRLLLRKLTHLRCA